MPVFKDDQEVYQYIGKLFQDLTDDDELSPKFRRADTIVQYRYTNPDSQITVKMKEGEDGQVDFGPTDMRARDRDVDGGRHRAQVLAREGERHDGAGEGPDEGQGPGREDPEAGAAGEAGFPRYQKMLEEENRDDLLKAA